MLANQLKTSAAHGIINTIHYSCRLGEKLTGKVIGFRERYWIMKIFRLLGKRYLVDISYPNPLEPKRQLELRLDLCGNTQQWLFREPGFYELPWMRAIRKGLEEADCFLDIGANVGIFSLTVGQAYPEKQMIAVEPLFSNFDLLETNIQKNGLNNIQPLHGVVGSKKGTERFYINPIHDGGGSIVSMREYRTGNVSIDAQTYQKRHPHFSCYQDVASYRIDDLITKKSVLKIDVEGAELLVLESARESFKKGAVDMVVVEVIHETIDDCLRFLSEFDFDCFPYGGRLPLKIGQKLDHRTGNLLCLRKGSNIYNKVDLL